VVYTPQQNGRAEREMRTLVKAARTLIQGLDKYLWAEAINTATSVLNRTGRSPFPDKSPFELWCNKKVDFKLFRVFGTTVSVLRPKETRLKWDAILGYFVANPTSSIRQVSVEPGISKSSIQRILKKHKFQPFSFKLGQHLKEVDFPKRVVFSEFLLTSHYGEDYF